MTQEPETESAALLAVYLQDHHAGSVAGVELARRIARENRDGPEADELAALAEEIEDDKRTLEQLMERLDVRPDPIKDRLAWGGEKLGRLKRNGTWISYSPLSRVVELDGLLLGVTGKLALWEALRTAIGEAVDGVDFRALCARAEDQRERIAGLRIAAVTEAFRRP